MIKYDHHCGPSWFPRWFKRLLGKYILDNEECAIHDHHNDVRDIPIAEADKIFALGLWGKAGFNIIKRIAAVVAYPTVRIYGILRDIYTKRNG